MTPEVVLALAARRGRKMHFYVGSWENLRAYLVDRYPDKGADWYDAEATRQADAYHHVVGSEPARCA